MQRSPEGFLRTIVVTGASSGIGRALAELCATQGWRVLAVARRADRLSSLSGVQTLALDVLTREAPQRIVELALQQFGGIDVVANLAGAAAPGNLLDQPDPAIERQWQLHVAAPLRIARMALPHVRQARGGFVFIGSGLARVPAPGYGAYAPAKAAIRAAAIQLRRELRAQGVFVTYVDPGVVDTEFSRASGMEQHEASWHAKPQQVAIKILEGINDRSSRVNAVWWQTVGTVAGEWFPTLADAAMSSLVTPPALPQAEPMQPVEAPPSDDFDTTLAPLRRRMERVNLSETFVRTLLVPGSEIALSDAAMRWAGMPNKNERTALREVLDALTAAQYLSSSGEERWEVLRTPLPPS